ncbi:hypothetical protein OE88DRAFT_1655905 [Heliocybe sulcata]|uniref:Uncharacterized protein n=1 Tax=Heliocybe sulcata TaxID=5364 RepID=A0A5C3NJ88_9AGAM|nr:hypothetical protein OE88DRAFT_1655905 [Heliocybe sulcata]
MSLEDISFPNPFTSQGEIFTLLECRIRALAGQILEKPEWWRKVRDEEIISKWRQEFTEQDAELVKKVWPKLQEDYDESNDDNGDWNANKHWPHKKITPEQLNYLFGWLRWLADQRDAKTGIEMMHIRNVYQSYSLVSLHLRDALLKDALVLESVPEAEKDWHPGSNNQVLDLIHPSLHCFRIGKTLVNHSETGSLYVPTVKEYMDGRKDLRFNYTPTALRPSSISDQHQWLPTDFLVSEDGEVKCLSYINNLHPDSHKSLYSTITSILAKFVPLWDRVLSDVLAGQGPIIVVDPYSWYDNRSTPQPELEGFKQQHPKDENAATAAYCHAEEEWWNSRDPYVPEPDEFSPPDAEDRVNFTLRGRTIQVIVKMANIILTPEEPEYAGGSWHVEGMDNERIVATGIYYYDSSNVTESKLSFRHALGEGMDMPYDQGDRQGYIRAYGVNGNEGPLNQELGYVVTKEGKCLAFPNIWQHCVSPFKLDNPSRPGHRKILCFFLVDPTLKIHSTSVVPPQQYEWYMRELRRAPALKKLPVELFDIIAGLVKEDGSGTGGAITLDQAKAVREELMEERANFVVELNEEVYEMEFNMCEH